MIRLTITALLFLIFVCSCNKQKQITHDVEQTTEPVKIYSQRDFDNKVSIIDSFCITETNRALDDLKKGKMILKIQNFENPQSTGSFYFFPELRKNLYIEAAKYKIEIDSEFIAHSCIVQRSDYFFNEYCYDKKMKEAVRKKYSEDIIKKISLAVMQDYIRSVTDSIFHYDERDRDITDIEHGDIIRDFIAYQKIIFADNLIYPDGYNNNSRELSSYTEVKFVLMKGGEIKDLKVNSVFGMKANNKFTEYFNEQVTRFVKSVKWLHPTISGIKVNSTIEFTFYYK